MYQRVPLAPIEAVAWDGANADAVIELAVRILGQKLGGKVDKISSETKGAGPNVGLNIVDGSGSVIARVELGNVLLADALADAPLFVLEPSRFAAFYQEV